LSKGSDVGLSRGRYDIWSQSDIVEHYRDKRKADFFATDMYFLSRISSEVRSIMDVGCAAGRLIELFRHFNYAADYLGLDISTDNIQAAKQIYPDHRFEVGDAVLYETDEKFDLVYSAGTMFHIPEYERTIQNMLRWSNRYVGFEVKFGPTADHIVDIDKSFCRIGDDRAFMVVLNLWKFLGWLTKQEGVGRIQIYGYKTNKNAVTFTPDSVGYFVSSCVFIEKGPNLHEIKLDLPAGLL
jgi:SAM-dependent methyltransferase